MPDLVDLPPDIKTLIFQHLRNYEDLKSAYSACMDLYGVVLPLVYNKIRLREDISISKLCSLLNLDNPGLRHIRHIELVVKAKRNKAERCGYWVDTYSMLANQSPRDILLSLKYVSRQNFSDIVSEQRLTLRKLRHENALRLCDHEGLA